ncbi:MAG: hypothetical protein METHP_00195 [Methanoregula sp. SKADARSKE-2]|nr:MAG: hypothetical protein METHP_00195 [Methanoregula sp. SKADARSKE-2]
MLIPQGHRKRCAGLLPSRKKGFLPIPCRSAPLSAGGGSRHTNRSATAAISQAARPGRGATKILDSTCAYDTCVDELSTFEEFTRRHIQPDPDRSVQCMLLWTEWVRFYLKRSRSFPEKVLEKAFFTMVSDRFETDFFTMVSDRFETEIACYDRRGPVYLGIRFNK